MAHYAFLNMQNIVTEVIVGKDETDGPKNWEIHYGNLREQVCKRTSYNTIGGTHVNNGTPFRKNYAGIGYTYDYARDAFIPPKPYDSWTLDANSCLWEAPVAYPNDGQVYTWNEETQQWDLVDGTN
jgi:hypothetical protein|tara:strand:+ start:1374 stop:1751 length:378 start_codon:yes stop_codon:yes gene_type:complete